MQVPNAPRIGQQATQSPSFQAPQSAQFQDASGQQLAAAGKTLDAATNVQAQIQERLDVTRAKAGANALSDRYRALLRSPEGFLNTTGAGTIAGRDDVAEELDKIRQEISDGMENESQRSVFMLATERDRQRSLTVVDGHYMGQLKAEEAEQAAARATTKSRDALDIFMESGAGDDFNDAQAAVFGPDGELSQLLDAQGVTGDARSLAISDAQDQFAGQLVARLSDDGQSQMANDVITQLLEAGDLSKGAAAKLREITKDASVAERSQQISVDVQRKFPTLAGQFKELDRLWESKKISVEERDAAVSRIARSSQILNANKAKDRNDALRNAQNWATLNRGKAEPLLRASMYKGLRDLGVLDDYKVWELNGGQWVTTVRGTRALLTMTQEKLAKYETQDELVAAWRTELDDTRIASLVKMWGEARKPGKMVDAMSIGHGDQVLDMLKRKGILLDTATLDDEATVATVDTWVAAIADDVNGQGLGRKAVMSDLATSFDKLHELGVVGKVPLKSATAAQRSEHTFTVTHNGQEKKVNFQTLARQVPEIQIEEKFDGEVKTKTVPMSYEALVEKLEANGKEVNLKNIGKLFLDELDYYNKMRPTRAATKRGLVMDGQHQAIGRAHTTLQSAISDIWVKEMPEGMSVNDPEAPFNRIVKLLREEHGADLISTGVDLDGFFRGVYDHLVKDEPLRNPTAEEREQAFQERQQEMANRPLPPKPKFGSLGGVRY